MRGRQIRSMRAFARRHAAGKCPSPGFGRRRRLVRLKGYRVRRAAAIYCLQNAGHYLTDRVALGRRPEQVSGMQVPYCEHVEHLLFSSHGSLIDWLSARGVRAAGAADGMSYADVLNADLEDMVQDIG